MFDRQTVDYRGFPVFGSSWPSWTDAFGQGVKHGMRSGVG
jgi:hypothetical protein